MTEQTPTLQDDLSAMPLAKVAELLKKAEGDAENAKLRIALFQGELTRRFKADFDPIFQEIISGERTLERDGLTLKGEVSKRVKWDSKALMEIAGEMPWNKVKELFKIDFSVTETIYKTLKSANEELYGRVTAARTVQYGDLKVTIKS